MPEYDESGLTKAETSASLTHPKVNLGCLAESIEKLKPIKIYVWKKAEVYKDNPDKAPVWLADEFNIMWIKYSEYIPEGKEGILPYLEPYEIPEEGKMYDEVILLKHKDLGEEVLDIDLTGRALLRNFIPD